MIESNQRLHPKLVHENRLFRFNKSKTDCDVFRCVCTSRYIMVTKKVEDMGYRELINESGNHLSDCLESIQEVWNAWGRQKILAEARAPEAARRYSNLEVYNEVRSRIPDQYRDLFYTFNYLERSMNRAARENTPPLPQDLASLDYLPEELCHVRGMPFVLFFISYPDEKDNNVNQKLLCLATEDDCRRLCNAERVFADGTFKVVPFPFSGTSGQLFTLSTLYGTENNEKLYGRVYVLCSHRTAQMYRLLFQKLLEVCQEKFGIDIGSIAWKTFTLDFEEALKGIIPYLNTVYFSGMPSC